METHIEYMYIDSKDSIKEKERETERERERDREKERNVYQWTTEYGSV